jgi:hypothetical protein
VQYHKALRRRGGAHLIQYRLYYLDSVDRLISRSFEFEAEDDETAIRLAETYRDGKHAELWTGTRKLKVWK